MALTPNNANYLGFEPVRSQMVARLLALQLGRGSSLLTAKSLNFEA